jgi:hypothetical protein
LGWQFTVGGSDLTCNVLRYYNEDPGSFTRRVKLHRVSDGATIAQRDFSGSFAQDAWIQVALSEFTLVAGTAYTISSRAFGGGSRLVARNPSAAEYYSGFTKTGNVFSNDDNLPTSVTSNVYDFIGFGYTP